jgi:hypothetical protein
MSSDDNERNGMLIPDDDSDDGDFQLALSASQNSVASSDRSTRSMVGNQMPVRRYVPGVIYSILNPLLFI